MSQNPPPPPDTPPPRQQAELTDQQLAAQARAAADQALQLAKLAEESARLARHLNEQVLARTRGSISHDDADALSCGETESDQNQEVATPFLLSTVAEPLAQSATRRGRRSRSHGTSRRERSAPKHGPDPDDALRQVTIRVTPERPGDRANATREFLRNWKSLVLSTSFHLLVLIVLGLFTFIVEPAHPIDTILASFVDADDTPEEAAPVEAPVDPEPEAEKNAKIEPETEPEPLPIVAEPESIDPPAEAMPPPINEPLPNRPGDDPKPPMAAPAIDLEEVGSRSQAGKEYLLKKYGGTAGSESAVSRALDWLVTIQRRDGSWNFNDVGRASQAGTVNNPMGATSYVLLAFLGTGQTHFEGKYKQSVAHGLRFLLQNGRAVPAGADFRGPNAEENHNFYVQGAAAMALCEAYALTKDRKLRRPAEGAVQFIIAAQDPRGGGWRYAPREPGCTSVTTLQLTALIAAQNCGLTTPPRTLDGVRHFYTTVKCDQEPTGRHAYRAEGLSYRASSTAQAALGRMYLGVPRDDEDLRAAVALLDERGPYENRYYCYYATQVLKNWGGPEWERWNESLREELIHTQDSSEGPARGSWVPLQRGPTDVSGGRLFATVLSTLTLEVYYRYLPLYDQNSRNAAAAATNMNAAADEAPTDAKPAP